MKSTSLVVSLAALIPATTLAFMHNNDSPQRKCNVARESKEQSRNSNLNLFRSSQEATAEAEQICYEEGPDSERCKVAWDIVEELKAADSHDRNQAPGPSELSYSPLVQGLDILSTKIERKMDELRNLSTQLAEYGAGPEVERLIYASDEMKLILEEARTAMTQYR
ncbi:hypothetical protein ACHAW5_006849 [Stephanodiscus triporus]|uniref:CP12 domain-containing protein n=1 Tax=Stephanodiscus triporus TaxID=2934178 RepID=A0ABD3PY56_9STRA